MNLASSGTVDLGRFSFGTTQRPSHRILAAELEKDLWPKPDKLAS